MYKKRKKEATNQTKKAPKQPRKETERKKM